MKDDFMKCIKTPITKNSSIEASAIKQQADFYLKLKHTAQPATNCLRCSTERAKWEVLKTYLTNSTVLTVSMERSTTTTIKDRSTTTASTISSICRKNSFGLKTEITTMRRQFLNCKCQPNTINDKYF